VCVCGQIIPVTLGNKVALSRTEGTQNFVTDLYYKNADLSRDNPAACTEFSAVRADRIKIYANVIYRPSVQMLGSEHVIALGVNHFDHIYVRNSKKRRK